MHSDHPGTQWLSALDLMAANSVDALLKRAAVFVSESLDNAQCRIWWMDRKRNGLHVRVAYSTRQMETFSAAFIPYDLAYQSGLFGAEEACELKRTHEIQNLKNSIFVRIHYDNQTNGLFAVLKPEFSAWTQEERDLLTATARSVSAGCCNLEHLNKRTQLLDILRKLGESTYEDPVAAIALESGKALIGCDRGVLRRINLKSGELEVRRASPKPDKPFPLVSGEGISGLAFRNLRPYRIDDVAASEWQPYYRALWKGARSELAVPILLPHARVRIGKKVKFVEKPFGVLNFESPSIAAFSAFHEECIVLLTHHMARVLERLEFDNKLEKLRKVERAMANTRDWDPGAIADKFMEEIRDTLGFEYVSFSTVRRDTGVVRCYRVLGLDEYKEFCKAAVHELNGNNIQADVVRTKQTEVPSADDPRLDKDLNERFGLDRLIRVFIPVLASNREEVLGTVSAGYNREHRPYIYERDIQILKGFVDFAGGILEARRWGEVTRVSHEMNAPLSALRNNLSRLRRRRRSMPEDRVDRILEDMATDTEVLRFQVQRLEYTWGGKVGTTPRPPAHLEPVLLFRDLIFKTIQELKPMVRDKGLDPARVSYDIGDVYKIGRVYVDKSKISQVIFNLFVNAVKYSENPETFQIRIGAEEERDWYVVKFCDWGIGVPEGLEERIFEEGFRAPVAVQKEVSGSGIGLTIAKQIMLEHGGDLILKNRAKPTEFDILIPKKPRVAA